MTPIIVNDTSCLIDLRKGRLLRFLCRLPHRLIVPLPIRESELLNFTAQEWALLDSNGMETYDLPPEQMVDVFALKRQHSRLSGNDCICLVTAQCHENSILLTGDRLLRKAAEAVGIRVQGVLWVVDELKAENICDDAFLVSALEVWKADRSVFLPGNLIDHRLHRFR